ncbi:hypothetical protein RB200_17435 [Streptomyces sp. PmtG]
MSAAPRLELIGRWAQAARADGRREPMMTVSSTRADKPPLLAAAGAQSTNSGEHMAYWLTHHEQVTAFVYLDSLPRIREAQHSVFPVLAHLAHATAIEDGVLAGYQLIVPTITDTDLRTQDRRPRGREPRAAAQSHDDGSLMIGFTEILDETLSHVVRRSSRL